MNNEKKGKTLKEKAIEKGKDVIGNVVVDKITDMTGYKGDVEFVKELGIILNDLVRGRITFVEALKRIGNDFAKHVVDVGKSTVTTWLLNKVRTRVGLRARGLINEKFDRLFRQLFRNSRNWSTGTRLLMRYFGKFLQWMRNKAIQFTEVQDLIQSERFQALAEYFTNSKVGRYISRKVRKYLNIASDELEPLLGDMEDRFSSAIDNVLDYDFNPSSVTEEDLTTGFIDDKTPTIADVPETDKAPVLDDKAPTIADVPEMDKTPAFDDKVPTIADVPEIGDKAPTIAEIPPVMEEGPRAFKLSGRTTATGGGVMAEASAAIIASEVPGIGWAISIGIFAAMLTGDIIKYVESEKNRKRRNEILKQQHLLAERYRTAYLNTANRRFDHKVAAANAPPGFDYVDSYVKPEYAAWSVSGISRYDDNKVSQQKKFISHYRFHGLNLFIDVATGRPVYRQHHFKKIKVPGRPDSYVEDGPATWKPIENTGYTQINNQKIWNGPPGYTFNGTESDQTVKSATGTKVLHIHSYKNNTTNQLIFIDEETALPMYKLKGQWHYVHEPPPLLTENLDYDPGWIKNNPPPVVGGSKRNQPLDPDDPNAVGGNLLSYEDPVDPVDGSILDHDEVDDYNELVKANYQQDKMRHTRKYKLTGWGDNINETPESDPNYWSEHAIQWSDDHDGHGSDITTNDDGTTKISPKIPSDDTTTTTNENGKRPRDDGENLHDNTDTHSIQTHAWHDIDIQPYEIYNEFHSVDAVLAKRRKANYNPNFDVKLANFLAAFASEAYKGDAPENKIIKANYEINTITCGTCAQAVIYSRKRQVIIAFRGTANLRDAFMDLNLQPMQTRLGVMHSGFWRYYETVLKHILDDLRNFFGVFKSYRKHKEVYITGHSLGGALAQIFSMEFGSHFKNEKLRACYVYNSPAWGTMATMERFNELPHPSWRVFHEHDPVSTIFRHISNNATQMIAGQIPLTMATNIFDGNALLYYETKRRCKLMGSAKYSIEDTYGTKQLTYKSMGPLWNPLLIFALGYTAFKYHRMGGLMKELKLCAGNGMESDNLLAHPDYEIYYQE